LPTGADGAARSEFERAARFRTLRAPPSAAPPKPAEATLGFSSTRKTIDIPPVRRYCSGQKKRWFKIPIQITNYANIVPSHYTVDLAVSYDMGDQPENEYLRNISLQLVVNNVTNKRPPFAYKASTSGSGGSAFWGLVDSPIQRQISLTITKTW
jgi:outer membrane receptor protein involved in Fe transport